MRPKALFLDRDGVINIDHGYVFESSGIEFIPGIFELCRFAHRNGYLIIIVTNQAGIGRGYYSETDFFALMKWMCHVFEENGAPIANVYYCPTHPTHGIGNYKIESPRRKPNPGMILDAQRDFNLDLGRSILIGDKESDIAAGFAAGVGTTVLFSPPESNGTKHSTGATATVQMLIDTTGYMDKR